MTIKQNHERLRQRIEQSCRRAQRDPAGVRILAVCKGQSAEALAEGYDCGIRLFGENRLQEAEVHMAVLPHAAIEWHFIGRLQKNKINKILESFRLIESVDSVKNLEHIHKRVDRPVAVFLEVNVGEEKSKTGFTLEGLKKAVPYISRLENIRVIGLMAIPPAAESAEAARPHFAAVRRLADEIMATGAAHFELRELSLGMSQDFEVAVEEGATIVRIGTALFGRRRV